MHFTWPGPAGSLWPNPRRRPWAALLPALALVVAGCAQPDTGTAHSGPAAASSSPATVTVGPDDGGRQYFAWGDNRDRVRNWLYPNGRHDPNVYFARR